MSADRAGRQGSVWTVDLVVFDVGGTLIQDRGEVPRALVQAFELNGVRPDQRQIAELRGAGKREAIGTLLHQTPGMSDEAAQRLVDSISASFRECLSAMFQVEAIRPVESAIETLQWLRTAGIRVGLNTGFERETMDLILAQCTWLAAADAIVCADEVSRGRPAPYMIFRTMELAGIQDTGRVIAVGDTVNDLLAGANAGTVGIVGVLTGSQGPEKLMSVPHTHILQSVAGIPGLIQREFHRV